MRTKMAGGVEPGTECPKSCEEAQEEGPWVRESDRAKACGTLEPSRSRNQISHW